MTTVAWLLMGALGKKKKEAGLDVSRSAGMLATEKQAVEQQSGGFALGSVPGLLTGGGGESSGSGGGGGRFSILGTPGD